MSNNNMDEVDYFLDLDVGDEEIKEDYDDDPRRPQMTKHARPISHTPKDGEPSPGKGPCKCGQKHWFNGVEYDYVMRLETNDGMKMLPYNKSDNPYVIAQQFVEANSLGSWNDRTLVAKLADRIMKNTEETTDHSKVKEEKPQFDPYAPSITVPANTLPVYNKQTQSFQKTTYFSTDEQYKEEQKQKREKEEQDEKIKKDREAARKKLQAEKERQMEEAEKIKQKIENDRKEREAANKERMERLNAQQHSALPISSSQRPVLDGSGQLKWVQGPSFGGIPLNSSQDDQQPPISPKKPSTSQSISGGGSSGGGGGIRSISDLRSKKNDDEDDRIKFMQQQEQLKRQILEGELNKDDWTIAIMIQRQNIHGTERLQHDLAKSGFSPDKIEQWIKVVDMLNGNNQRRRRMEQNRRMRGNLNNSRGGRESDSDDDLMDDDDDDAELRRRLKMREMQEKMMEQDQMEKLLKQKEKELDQLEKEQSNRRQFTNSSGIPLGGAGVGHTLGGSSGGNTLGGSLGATPMHVDNNNNSNSNNSIPKKELVVNHDSPSTVIQVRLAGGGAEKVKINLTHTVQDLIDHIASISGASSPFTLMTAGLPRKTLTDTKQTVKDAGLTNSVVIMTFNK